MKQPIAAALAAVFTLILPAASQAAPVTWHLVNAVFEDGGAASGSFVYDADTNAFSAINIVTTAGSIQGGANYGVSLPVWAKNNRLVSVTLPSLNLAGATAFSVTFASGLTNAGGIVALLPEHSTEGVCVNFICTIMNTGGNGARRFVSGYVTTSEVPLPAAAPLFLAALGGLAFARRGKRAF